MPDSPHDHSAAAPEGRPVEAQYVRQGRKGVRIVFVLGAALILVISGFVIVWLSWSRPLAEADQDNRPTRSEAAQFQGEGGQPIPAADAPTTATGQPTAPPTGEAPNVNAPVLTPPRE